MSGETKFTAEQEAKRNAAEDMYEALEALREYARPTNWNQAEAYITKFGAGPDAWRKLDDALAKARGESQ